MSAKYSKPVQEVLKKTRLIKLGASITTIVSILLAGADALHAQVRGSTESAFTQCRVATPTVAGLQTLSTARQALKNGSLRILALGSSSTSGVGASSANSTYPARLEDRLRKIFDGASITVVNRGIPGETIVGAAARIEQEVSETNPNVVIWQLGTNDAVRGEDLKHIESITLRVLNWLRTVGIDVVLINPQFVERFGNHRHYLQMVQLISKLAQRASVILIRRYSIMRELAQKNDLPNYLASDRFHLNDLGYRCLAAYAANAIIRASE